MENAQITLFLARLEAFNRATRELSASWVDAGHEESDAINDATINGYPFDKSFDDLAIEISKWTESVRNEIRDNAVNQTIGI